MNALKKPPISAIAEDRFLKIAEVVELTGFSRAKVYRLLDEGTLPCVRVGRSVRVRYRSLMEWMAKVEDATRLTSHVT